MLSTENKNLPVSIETGEALQPHPNANIAGSPDQPTYLVILKAQFAYFSINMLNYLCCGSHSSRCIQNIIFLRSFKQKKLLSKLSTVKTLERVDVELFKE